MNYDEWRATDPRIEPDDGDDIYERERAQDEYRHVGQMLTQITRIADELVPHPAESNRSSQLWRALVGYMNEELLGEELAEANRDACRPVSGYGASIRPLTESEQRMGALREWLSLENAV